MFSHFTLKIKINRLILKEFLIQYVGCRLTNKHLYLQLFLNSNIEKCMLSLRFISLALRCHQ